MAATLKEIAARAGLSYQAVSAVLNGYLEKASPENRKRIFAIAEELGYKPNAVARALVSGKTKLLGVLAQDTRFPYHADLAHELHITAQARGYQSLLMESNWNDEKTLDCFRQMQARQVDGFLLLGMPQTKEAINFIKRTGKAVVIIDGLSEQLPCVFFEYDRCMEDALAKLANAGRKNIAIAHDPVNKTKIGAFNAAAEKLGLKTSELKYVYAPIGGERQVYEFGLKIAKERNRPDALIISSDYDAALILKAFLSKGLRIPQDIALIAFDDTFICRLLEPSLAAFRLDRKAMSEAALDLLEARIEDTGLPPERISIEATLVERESAGLASHISCFKGGKGK